MAIDPAAGDMGIVVLDTTLTTCTVVHAETINGRKLMKDKAMKKAFEGCHGFVISQAYKTYLWWKAREWRPDRTVVERAFTHRFPAVLVSLTIVIHAVREAIWLALGYNVDLVSPMETKKMVAGKGNAKKPEIEAGVRSLPDLVYGEGIDPTSFSEHVWDAIGHGYTLWKLSLKGKK